MCCNRLQSGCSSSLSGFYSFSNTQLESHPIPFHHHPFCPVTEIHFTPSSLALCQKELRTMDVRFYRLCSVTLKIPNDVKYNLWHEILPLNMSRSDCLTCCALRIDCLNTNPQCSWCFGIQRNITVCILSRTCTRLFTPKAEAI